MEEHDESLAMATACTMTASELDIEFEAGFGTPEGAPFTVWTNNRVYFPLESDGAKSCGSVARHPDGQPTEHQ